MADALKRSSRNHRRSHSHKLGLSIQASFHYNDLRITSIMSSCSCEVLTRMEQRMVNSNVSLMLVLTNRVCSLNGEIFTCLHPEHSHEQIVLSLQCLRDTRPAAFKGPGRSCACNDAGADNVSVFHTVLSFYVTSQSCINQYPSLCPSGTGQDASNA